MSLDQTLSALADPSRRQMVRRLAETRPGLSISELAAPLPIALPTVMKHLDVLSQAGLIERRKTGRVVTVTLRPAPMAEATEWLERTAAFWSERLDRLAAFAESLAAPSAAFTLTRHLAAPPAAVFAMLADPAAVPRWWGSEARAMRAPQPGGGFRAHRRIADQVRGATGTVEDYAPPHRLTARWAWDDDPAVTSRIALLLAESGGGTMLTVSVAPAGDVHDAIEHGWAAALDRLAALVTEGT